MPITASSIENISNYRTQPVIVSQTGRKQQELQAGVGWVGRVGLGQGIGGCFGKLGEVEIIAQLVFGRGDVDDCVADDVLVCAME